MAGNKEKNFASAVVYVKNDAVRIGGFLKGVVNPNAGGFQVDQENSWQQEQNKQVRKRRSRARKQADAERLYALKQQQKREKHKGH